MNPHSVWFTADLHFGHDAIVRHDAPWPQVGRQFESIEEHDAAVVDSINSLVRPTDTLYVLGDFAFRCAKPVWYYRGLINCRNVVLVPGNHDPGFAYRPQHTGLVNLWQFDRGATGTEQVAEYGRVWDLAEHDSATDPIHEVKVLGQRIVLCHYPLLRWNESHKGAWHLHGHVHGCVESVPGSLDVGINVWGRPLSYADVAWQLRNFTATPHHPSIDSPEHPLNKAKGDTT